MAWSEEEKASLERAIGRPGPNTNVGAIEQQIGALEEAARALLKAIDKAETEAKANALRDTLRLTIETINMLRRQLIGGAPRVE